MAQSGLGIKLKYGRAKRKKKKKLKIKMMSNPLAETYDGNYIGIKIQKEDRPNSKSCLTLLQSLKK
jgi:hypothetical protein